MKRLILNLSISVLTFALGVALSSFWSLYTLPDTPEAFLASQQGSEPLRIIRGMDACGPEGNSHVYELSDGGHVSTECQRFRSPAAAAQALQRRLGQAEIIERFSNLDENGHAAGEIILTNNPVLRLSVHGDSFCVTEASSLKHLHWQLEQR